MAVAARVDPKTFFAPEQWARLTARSDLKGLALIAHAWGVIGLAVAMAMVWPITIPLAVMIIGGRQLGLAILMHDAAHGALCRNLKLNDWVGEHLTAGGLKKYRPYHLQHHKYAQQSEDPDLVLSAPFPITRRSLRRKILRDLTGQTWLKMRWGQVAAELKARKPGEPVWPILARELKRKRRFLIGGLVTTAVFAPFGFWWVWPALWVLPAATWLQMITRLRNIAEHACIAKDEPDPLRHARTTRANLIERAVLAPYWVNYHCEHHMFMHLPCYSLPRAHRLLKAQGVTGRMEVQLGYLKVLAMASSKPERALAAA
ncbi:MAG: fatty acid desaturase family protein [Phenylobacterium sp.]|jgi:fatty acid desaturase|uniref:fatty acid desaturase family protein n=1 Tax=Phenylobacterium sp. TaxID=1871053 RepID=UPI002A2D685C|nr:fatty acid desaturase family protein [Phenylobacterium sp.]MDD3836512.1 fatty acid desaturase family protein [Phenylobacterium sp.]MDX9997383.1 fatty acid desaturase family protein [Phenylobacterium sp.]